MQLEQLSVFLENRSGGLAEVVQVIADAGVNIRAASVADMAEFGILRLLVDDTEKARRVLHEAGYTAAKTNVVAVAVPVSWAMRFAVSSKPFSRSMVEALPGAFISCGCFPGGLVGPMIALAQALTLPTISTPQWPRSGAIS